MMYAVHCDHLVLGIGRSPRAAARDAEAHGAGADAEATMDVWLEQLTAHADIPGDMDGMAKYASMSEHEPVDIAGKLYRDAEGFVCFAFGKNKDKRVSEQKGYALWCLKKDFPGSTLDALDAELSRLENL